MYFVWIDSNNTIIRASTDIAVTAEDDADDQLGTNTSLLLGNWTVIAYNSQNDAEVGRTIFILQETSPPNITLNYPPDNYLTTQTSINFNWTVTDTYHTNMTCNLTINGIVNASNISAVNGTPVNYSVGGFSDGAYYWNVTCWDESENSQTSETWNFTIDSTLPSWSNLSEKPNDPAYYVPNQYYEFNITWYDYNLDTVWIEWDGTNYTQEISNDSNVYTFNRTNLLVGVHNYNWYANDTFGQISSISQNYTILALPDYTINCTLKDGEGNKINSSVTIYNSSDAVIYSNNNSFYFTFDGTQKYKIEVDVDYPNFNKFWLLGVFNNTNSSPSIKIGNNIEKKHHILDPSSLNYDHLVWQVQPFDSEDGIFFKCFGNYNFTTSACEGTWEPWYNIKGPGFVNYTFKSGDPALSEGDGLFFEDWETNNLSTNNWTVTGPGNPWVVSITNNIAGVYSARTINTNGETNLTTIVSTEGYQNITFSYLRDTRALDVGVDYLSVYWYNGTDWIWLETTDTHIIGGSASWNLTSDANNNPYLKIRFVCSTNHPVEQCIVDNIQVNGTALAIAPSVSILYPQNGAIYNTYSLFIRANASGDNIDSCWYNLNNAGNTTFNCSSEPDITVVEGLNNLTVYANNTNNELGNDSISFTVNTSIPLTISITSPPNGTFKTSMHPKLKLLAIDNDYNLINYTIYVYYENNTLFSIANNGTLTNNTETEIVLSSHLDLIGNLTTYKIIANATDAGNNNATSGFLYYTLTQPAIELVSPPHYYWSNHNI